MTIYIVHTLSEDTKQFVRSLADAYQHNIGAKLNTIIMNQAEATAKLNEIGTQLTKVGGETTTLLTKVDDLTKALADAQANGGAITPELEAAINSVATQAKTVDDLVPDAPAA